MRPALLFCCISLLVASCSREEAAPTKDTQTKASQRETKTVSLSTLSPVQSLQQLAAAPAELRVSSLTKHIYRVADDDLDLVVESILTLDDPVQRRTLLSTLYEETQIRPPAARLPLILEIARHADADPSLRSTIMAELGATLAAEHGSSWADWALAMEEHLAETQGLIRVR